MLVTIIFHYQSYCRIIGIGSEIFNIFDRSNTLKNADSTESRYRFRLIGKSLVIVTTLFNKMLEKLNFAGIY